MAKGKQREVYGTGSVNPEMTVKKDKSGNPMLDKDGKPRRVQLKNKRGQPVWRVVISLGTEQYKDKDGRIRRRQRKVQKRFAGTLAEAREYCKGLSDEYSTVDFDKATDNFSALCKEWEEKGLVKKTADGTKVPKCSEKQKRQYVRHLGYVSPYLDGKPVAKIEDSDVEEAMEAVRRERNLSVTTLNKILAVVARVFEYGIVGKYIKFNPCRGIEPMVSTTKRPRKALSGNDAAKLRIELDKAEEAAYQAYDEKEQRQAEHKNTFGRSSVRNVVDLSNLLAMRLLLATGARRGEILGLQWGNVDLATGAIRIAQTINEQNIIKEPKTEAGIRNLFIDEYTLAHLRKWQQFQQKALHLVNVDGIALTQDSETPVFCSNVGGYLDPCNFGKWWNRFRAEVGCNGVLVHEMRHTSITLLQAEFPEDIELIKTRVGHSRPHDVTWGYTHELPARDKKLADAMGRILYETKVKNDQKESEVIPLKKSA